MSAAASTTAIVLSPDLEAAYQREINDPKKRGFFRVQPEIIQQIRERYELQQRLREKSAAWMSLSDAAFVSRCVSEPHDEVVIFLSQTPEVLQRARALQASIDRMSKSVASVAVNPSPKQ